MVISKFALGANVQRQRERKGRSRYWLAKQSGVSCGTIRSLENGRIYPRIDTLICVAESLGCTVGELTEETANG
nr:MAG TPA: helix-turn-helix domain protein [Caudoviricetes sp.]